MGNCQAAETAAAVVQRPDGKAERLYGGEVRAGEVMTSHPGFHVALLLSSGVPHGGSLRVTRIKLLRPSDPLLLGHVYRLVSSQEVMKGLRAKKCAKMKKLYEEFAVEEEKNGFKINPITLRSESDSSDKHNLQKRRHGRLERGGSNNHCGGNTKARAWQPSLQSISESAS